MGLGRVRVRVRVRVTCGIVLARPPLGDRLRVRGAGADVAERRQGKRSGGRVKNRARSSQGKGGVRVRVKKGQGKKRGKRCWGGGGKRVKSAERAEKRVSKPPTSAFALPASR